MFPLALAAVKYKALPSLKSPVSKFPILETCPVTSPVTSPVKLAITVPATKFSEPIVHLSFVSSQRNVLLELVPLSISIPPSCDGVPASSELRTSMLSPIFTVFEFTVVVVPFTVKLPEIIAEPNVTASVVPTACPIAISPLDTVTPVPTDICALTSLALGPVYVITPVPLLYANRNHHHLHL